MSGTRSGGLKATKTNKERHGEDFFRKIGAKGGHAKVPKGFALSGKAREAGEIGGRISRRGKAK